jgi:NAD(P)-dependent dehydrogenase (short-subunit alcohol dehydrogenase family)
VPMGFLGEPSDIANAVAFLARDESRYITGQNLAVNGGRAFN